MRTHVAASPEEVRAALTELRENHGATDYDGDGPPTETSVGLREKDFKTLPARLLQLLLTVNPEILSFDSCRKLRTLPEGSTISSRSCPSPYPP